MARCSAVRRWAEQVEVPPRGGAAVELRSAGGGRCRSRGRRARRRRGGLPPTESRVRGRRWLEASSRPARRSMWRPEDAERRRSAGRAPSEQSRSMRRRGGQRAVMRTPPRFMLQKPPSVTVPVVSCARRERGARRRTSVDAAALRRHRNRALVGRRGPRIEHGDRPALGAHGNVCASVSARGRGHQNRAGCFVVAG